MALAFQLKDTAFKVNSVCPGFTATDLNNHTGVNKASDSAKIIAHYAMLEENGPGGQFFNAADSIPW